MNNSSRGKKTELLIIFSIMVPSIIIYLRYQSLFEFNFNLFSNEQLLILIPSDGGLGLLMFGLFSFFGGLVTFLFQKRGKTRKISSMFLMIGIIMVFFGLQNYTTFTNTHVIESKGYKIAKIYHEYSEISKFEIEVDVYPHQGQKSNYGLNCSPHFTITALVNPYKKLLTVRVVDVDRELVYKLIDILRNKNIPLQHIVLNNCMNHPDQFKAFEDEFNQKLAR